MRPTVAIAAGILLAASLAGDVNAGNPPPTATAAAPSAIPERAQALKEAASLLEKAAAARDRGAKSFAEQLFSSAELIVGADVLADLAPLFREGAPPRLTTPLKQVPRDSAPQPVMVGNSEEEEPPPKPLKGALYGTVLADGKPIEGLSVITLEPATGKWKRRSPKQRVMEQRNRQFAPRVLVVPVGSTVTFPNFDTVYHNVFSDSKLQEFDLGLYKNGAARDVTFDKEGVIALGCNLHANMTAHIVVVSAPHYVISDEQGKFAFKNLEPGPYKLRAWSERSLTPITREVVVKPDRNTVTVEVKADAPKGPRPDKFGAKRAG